VRKIDERSAAASRAMSAAAPGSRERGSGGDWPLDRVLLTILCFILAAAAGYHGKNAFLMLRDVELDEPEPMLLAGGLSAATACVYILLMACLFVVRLPLVAKYAELWPRIVALLGSFLPFTVTFFPPADELSLTAHIVASAVSLAGMALAVYILYGLGRSFSITPQARGLVTTGPYRFVRHPLYVAEYIASVGVLIHFLSPWTVLITLCQGYLQIRRMDYEERLLARVFPEYAAYAKRTARILPGVY
jgi:protein-S-isoprenylcysteine O-methyltransferase Ste14